METCLSMQEASSYMVDGADAGEGEGASAPSWLDGVLECVRGKMPALCLGHDARGAPLDHLAAPLKDRSFCNVGLHHVEKHLQLVS